MNLLFSKQFELAIDPMEWIKRVFHPQQPGQSPPPSPMTQDLTSGGHSYQTYEDSPGMGPRNKNGTSGSRGSFVVLHLTSWVKSGPRWAEVQNISLSLRSPERNNSEFGNRN